MTGEKITIWQGVYSSFAEAPANDPIFDGEIWLEKQVARLERDRAAANESGFIPRTAETYDYVLPVVAAMVAAERKKVRILDFGGGLASSFFSVVGALPGDVAVDFHIVETKAVCAKGRELLGDEARLHFHEELPDGLTDVDIVHAGSALHYVEDWRGLLARFVKLAPRSILLSDLPAGDIETFVTVQNFHGRKIPVWFWNAEEIADMLSASGYGLVLKSNFVSRLEDHWRPLPMENFPECRRLTHTCSLLFRVGEATNSTPV